MVFAVGQWAKGRRILQRSTMERVYVTLNRLLIDTLILTTLPIRNHKEVRRVAGNIYAFKNTCVIINKLLVEM